VKRDDLIPKEEEKKGRSVVPLNLQGAAAEGREGSMIKSKTPIRVAIFFNRSTHFGVNLGQNYMDSLERAQ